MDDIWLDPDYQQFVSEQAKYCRCDRDVPCDGVLAGGLCDDMRAENEPDWYEPEDDED